MIDALEEAFKEVAQLPEDEQRYIIEIIRQEIASEHRWQTLFHDPRSEPLLDKLVNEALAEDAFGAISRSFCGTTSASTTAGKCRLSSLQS